MTESANNAQEDLGHKVVINSIASVGAKLIYLVSRLAIPPLILAHVSLEEYGLWSYCFVVIGYMGMSTMGFSMVFILAGANYINTKDVNALNAITATGFWLSMAMGAVLMVAGYFGVPYIVDSLHLKPELQNTAYWLIVGTSVSFLLCMTLGSLGALIIGLQKILAEQTLWVISFLLETAVMLVLLQLGWGVYSLLAGFAARYIFVVLSSLWYAYRWIPGLSIHWTHCSKDALKQFLGYGSVIQATGFLSTMLRSAERVLAGWLLNVKSVAILDLGQKFPMMSMALPSSVNGSVVPAFAVLHAQGRTEEIKDLFVMATRHVNLFASALGGFFFAFATPIMLAWLGPSSQTQDMVFVMMLFSLPYHLDVITGPTSSIFRAINKPAFELIYTVSQAVLLGLLLLLGRWWMPDSLALVCWVVSSAMCLSAVFYCCYGQRHFKVSAAFFIRRALLPGLIPYVLGVVLAQGMLSLYMPEGRLASILVTLAGGTIYGVLCLVVAYIWIALPSEKEYLGTLIRKLRHKLGAAA